jgi:hypothetical protein
MSRLLELARSTWITPLAAGFGIGTLMFFNTTSI